MEFPDYVIANLCWQEQKRKSRHFARDTGIAAAYKMVDTCAAEFAAATPYYYSVYGGEYESRSSKCTDKKKVLGSWFRSDPYRTGYRV
ncbi:MAG: hypothetical protein ACLTBA_09910 [Roseburia intestinalis]